MEIKSLMFLFNKIINVAFAERYIPMLPILKFSIFLESSSEEVFPQASKPFLGMVGGNRSEFYIFIQLYWIY